MSKRVAASVIALFVAAGACPGLAQTQGVGGRIGPTFTTFGGDGNPDPNTGFIVSGLFIHGLSEHLSVHPELSYVRKGASFTGSTIDMEPVGNIVEQSLEHRIKLDYLELQVPITLMIPARRIGVRLYAGPAVALELNCSAELTIESETFAPSGARVDSGFVAESGRCGVESTLGYPPLGFSSKNIDFGLVFGAGIDVRVGRGAITGDLRYDLGITDLRGAGSTKNRALEILLGYAYYFSG